ncbi:hypothetical protein ACFPN1_11610 [Lysobacter yangpyeongensis]|uniref:Uncharacterized protein n=1 Tax=Lysobacter yangpyeongensis TaxID=346182 RepID=A0ABW0SNL5_9GAMM
MNSFHGAAVLIALLPVLPLAMVLRRRSRDPRAFRGAAAVSLVLLVCGIAAAVAGA